MAPFKPIPMVNNITVKYWLQPVYEAKIKATAGPYWPETD